MTTTWRRFSVATTTQSAWLCGECNDILDNQEKAIDCCSGNKIQMGWKCASCSELYEDSDEAVKCCPGAKAVRTDAWQCPHCKDFHPTADDANKCCQSSQAEERQEPWREKAWKCTECEQFHTEQIDAVECCHRDKMRELWVCSSCGNDYGEEYDALWCCDEEKAHEDDVYPCGECGRRYLVQIDAEECCEEVVEENPRAAEPVEPVEVDLDVASHYGLSSLYEMEMTKATDAWAKHRDIVLRWSSKKDLASAEVVRSAHGITASAYSWCDSGDDLIIDAMREDVPVELHSEVIEEVYKIAPYDLQIDDPDFTVTRELPANATLDSVIRAVEEAYEDAEKLSDENFVHLRRVVDDAVGRVIKERRLREQKPLPRPPEFTSGEGTIFENPNVPRDIGEIWEDKVEGFWYVQFPSMRQGFEKEYAERWSQQLKKDLRDGTLRLDPKIWTPEGVNRRKLPPEFTLNEGLVFENPIRSPEIVYKCPHCGGKNKDIEPPDGNKAKFIWAAGSIWVWGDRTTHMCPSCQSKIKLEWEGYGDGSHEPIEDWKIVNAEIIAIGMRTLKNDDPGNDLHPFEGVVMENPGTVSDMRRKRVAEGVRRAARNLAFEQGFGLHSFGDSIVVYAEPWNRWNLETLDLTHDEETEVIYEKISQYIRDNTIPDLEERGYKVLGWWQDHIGDGVAFGWTLVVAMREGRI